MYAMALKPPVVESSFKKAYSIVFDSELIRKRENTLPGASNYVGVSVDVHSA